MPALSSAPLLEADTECPHTPRSTLVSGEHISLCKVLAGLSFPSFQQPAPPLTPALFDIAFTFLFQILCSSRLPDSTLLDSALYNMVRTDGSQVSKAHVQAFKDAIKGALIVKGETPEAEYTAAIKRWNMMHVKQAQFVVMVESEADIQETVKFCRKFNIDFCISCGRHTFSGPSSCFGLVVDLRKLGNVEIDTEKKTATVGGGTIAENVERAAHAKGFRAVFGAVNETGKSDLAFDSLPGD